MPGGWAYHLPDEVPAVVVLTLKTGTRLCSQSLLHPLTAFRQPMALMLLPQELEASVTERGQRSLALRAPEEVLLGR